MNAQNYLQIKDELEGACAFLFSRDQFNESSHVTVARQDAPAEFRYQRHVNAQNPIWDIYINGVLVAHATQPPHPVLEQLDTAYANMLEKIMVSYPNVRRGVI